MKKRHYQILQEQIITGEELLLRQYLIIRETKKGKYSMQGIFGKINDPKEYVKVAVYVDLIDRLGYSVNQIEIDNVPPNSEKLVDMIVYEDETKKRPYIVIECRKENISDLDFEKEFKHAVDAARFLKASFAACIAGDRRGIVVIDQKNKGIILSDLPTNLRKKKEREDFTG